jgi:methylamine dehydrogenase accessory protein MauD
MEALTVSNALLWLAVVALGAVVLALTRQIGLLHERLGPVGARVGAAAPGARPEVGDAAPELQLADLAGRPLRVGGASPGIRTLLFVLSPSCPVCEELLPTVRRVADAESPGLRLVLASDGDPPEHHRFVRDARLGETPYVLSSELGLRFGVDRLPSAVLIDADGIVRARGLVNTREHLESLFQAHELGVASIEEHLARKGAALEMGGVS